MSWLEFRNLLDWLPMESRTKTAMRDDALDRRWGEPEYMQATMITLMQVLIRIAWVGGRLEGDPPKMSPPTLPQTTAELDELAKKRQERAVKLAQIRKLAPATPGAAGRVDAAAVAEMFAARKPSPKRTT